MKGKIIKDWNSINFSNPEHCKKFVGALEHFMKVPVVDQNFKAAMQHFATSGDFPATSIIPIIEKFHATTNYDNAYELLFDIRDFTSSNVSGFDISDVESGLAFSKVPDGGKIKVYKMSGTKARVTFDMYGGGLNWSRKLFDDKEYWTIEDNAIAFRNKAYSSKAANHYALIEAVSSDQNLAWQGVSTDSQASRDAQTIEKACYNILYDLKDKGYNVGPNSMFYVLTPLALRSRMTAALNLLNQSVAGSEKKITYNVQPLYTMMLSDQTKPYVILPKIKMKGGRRLDLTIFENFDILRYADTAAGWQRYGAGIGDTEQIQRLSLS